MKVIHDAEEASEEKTKASHLSREYHRQALLGLPYSRSHLIKFLSLRRVGEQNVFKFAGNSGSNVLLWNCLCGISQKVNESYVINFQTVFPCCDYYPMEALL